MEIHTTASIDVQSVDSQGKKLRAKSGASERDLFTLCSEP